MIKQTNSKGAVITWKYEHYEDGQLKRLNDMIIPWFEK